MRCPRFPRLALATCLATALGCGGSDTVALHLEPGCNPFATSEECVLPYPSAFYQEPDETSPTGVRVNYPEQILSPDGQLPDLGPANTADGVSPAGPILVHFGVDVNPDQLTSIHELAESLAPGSPIALFNYESGARVVFMSEMDMNRVPGYEGRYALIVRPLEPMAMGIRHVVAFTRDLTDAAGAPLRSPPAFAALRDGVRTDSPVVEGVRDHYEQLFAFLEERGYARKNLLLAWDFMVASEDYLLGSVLSMREEALAETGAGNLGYRITSVVDDPNADIARIVEGDFEVPSYLDADSNITYDADHHPVRQPDNGWYPFTMLIPQKARTLGAPLPLVVFGHGIFGRGREYLTGSEAQYIQPMAERTGTVIVATDWIGLSGGDKDLIISEVVKDLTRINLVTDRLQQSLVNNLVMTELTLGPISADPAVKLGDNELLDSSSVYYYGVSLGGIQGTSFVSLSNRVTRGVLAVPGSVWLNMMPRSIVWVPIKSVLDLYYPDPLIQQMGIAFVQTRFDHSDPINLSRLLYAHPLPDAPAGRRVIVQESIGDSQVPNMTTEMLARALGIRAMTPLVHDVFGLETVASPAQESVLVQYHLVDLINGDYPPEENVPPTDDNGAHSEMCFMPHVFDQVAHFVDTGEVVQYCDGPCDPD